ncbi:MAG TPA: T9SS type A sorting domain-containing protein [Rubricoccaceae bacterium]|jgi:photosystem II stability/assembly factor-like uncharacterized protein
MRPLPCRSVFPVALALVLALTASAQTPPLVWQRLAGPYGGAALGVASVPNGTGVTAVATDGEALYRSTDGGTWTPVPLGPSGFTGVYATPAGEFWTTGAAVLRSLDGGQTWADAGADLPAGGARSLAAQADGTLFAATSGGVYRRSPAATAWQPTAFSEPSSFVGVVPGGTVLAGLASTGIGSQVYSVARSTDGGQTWQTVPVGTYRRAEITGLAVLADGSVIVGGYPTSDTGRSASPFRSTDAGLTWAPITGLPEGLVVSRVVATGQTAAVTGSAPESYVSTDGGATWETVDLTVNGLAAGPAGPVLVATARRGILRSSDGLSTVTDATQGFGRAAVSQVEVRGDLVVAARLADFGFGTGLYRSADRGLTWTRTELGFGARGLSDLHIDPAGRLFASPDLCFGDTCAPSGVYRSLDGGVTWAPTPLIFAGSFTSGRLVDGPGGALWALFSTRALYRSLDGGVSWEQRAAPPHSKTFTVGPDGTLWAGSDQPDVSVARSTDAGASWTVVLPPSPGIRTGAIAVAADGSVVVGASGVGYRSADGGATWQTVDFGFAQPSHELDVIRLGPDGQLFAGADGGPPVLRSRDDGLTWAPVADGLPEVDPAVDLALGDGGVLWAALGAGGLYRTSASTVVAAEAPGGADALAVSVAPNPARAGASVTLTLGAAADLSVSVYDALGRRIARLHDGPAPAGALTLRLGTEALAPGVYVVRAAAGERTTTRRLVVVR